MYFKVLFVLVLVLTIVSSVSKSWWLFAESSISYTSRICSIDLTTSSFCIHSCEQPPPCYIKQFTPFFPNHFRQILSRLNFNFVSNSSGVFLPCLH